MDPLSKPERSELMSKVRATGNRSTELKVQKKLEEECINGWLKHPGDIPGKPDFYFPRERLVIFVDGCFWHACPRHGRIPKTRTEFWERKIDENRRRDNRTHRNLRRQGYHVMRIWEHEIAEEGWVRRVRRMLANS